MFLTVWSSTLLSTLSFYVVINNITIQYRYIYIYIYIYRYIKNVYPIMMPCLWSMLISSFDARNAGNLFGLSRNFNMLLLVPRQTSLPDRLLKSPDGHRRGFSSNCFKTSLIHKALHERPFLSEHCLICCYRVSQSILYFLKNALQFCFLALRWR